jgi:hypothetical protein
MKMVVFCIVAFAHAWCAFADDGSARRYVSLETNANLCKYALLSTKQVERHLKLTKAQLGVLRHDEQIPGFADLHASQAQKLEGAKSDEERSQIRRSGHEQAMALLEESLAAGLESTLTPTQLTQLNALFLQMKGPLVILEDTNLVQRLNLADEQISGLRKTAKGYKDLLSQLYHRYLRLQIQPIRQNRSDADVSAEIKSLINVIRGIERDQDYDLLGELNTQQRRLWDDLCGLAVSIEWKPAWFADVPFERSRGK